MIRSPREALRNFVCPRFPQHTITDADDIFDLGFVNSLFAMELVMFIERDFLVEVTNAELQLDHFRTIDAMVALVGRLRAVKLIGAGTPVAGS